jgi:hypothetical protein
VPAEQPPGKGDVGTSHFGVVDVAFDVDDLGRAARDRADQGGERSTSGSEQSGAVGISRNASP